MHFVLPGSSLEMANRPLARLPQGALESHNCPAIPRFT